MNEMLERIARAICASCGRNPDLVWSDGKPEWTMYEDNARAVISALREPTDAMKDAGNSIGHDEAPATYYRAMIESILTA